MSIEHLTESVRRQVATKQLHIGPDVEWARRIVDRKAAGETVSFYVLRLARQALEESSGLERTRSSNGA